MRRHNVREAVKEHYNAVEANVEVLSPVHVGKVNKLVLGVSPLRFSPHDCYPILQRRKGSVLTICAS